MKRALFHHGLSLASLFPRINSAPPSLVTHSRCLTTPAQPPKTNPRWLSELQSRAEKFLQQHSKSPSAPQVQDTLHQLRTKWLELSARREGFLAEERWRGINRQPIAWGDMDSMVSHVNNVVYNKLAETARVNWVTSFAQYAPPDQRQAWKDLLSPRSIGLILKSIKTDYKLPMTYPDKVTVLHKLTEEPGADSDSLLVEAVLFSERHQRVTARTYEDIVVYDYRSGRRAALPPFMVDELKKVWQLQLESQKEAEEQILSLERAVKQATGT